MSFLMIFFLVKSGTKKYRSESEHNISMISKQNISISLPLFGKNFSQFLN